MTYRKAVPIHAAGVHACGGPVGDHTDMANPPMPAEIHHSTIAGALCLASPEPDMSQDEYIILPLRYAVFQKLVRDLTPGHGGLAINGKVVVDLHAKRGGTCE